MIVTHLKIAWRNLTINKGYAIMNILGLALGMAVTILIALWLHDELNYNKNFENYDSIAQIYQSQTFGDGIQTGPAIPLPLEKVLREKYNGLFKHLVLSSWNDESVLKFGEQSIKADGNSMQSDAPKMLSLNIISGELNGLKDIHSIMLSETLAKKLFGDVNPIGKTIRFDYNADLKVTGVYQDLPFESSFYDLEWIATWDYYVSRFEWVKNSLDKWDNNSWQLFMQVADNTNFDSVDEAIRFVKKNHSKLGSINPTLHVYPMFKWNLYDNFENGKQIGGRIEYVYLFAGIGIIVLLLACINYMNIATARSEKRAKEVGVKKTLGAQKYDLVYQFYSESFLLTLFAFIIAIFMVLLVLNGFNELSNKQIHIPWSNLTYWGAASLIFGITVLISGSYPALYLSKFNPVQVLKGTFIKSNYSGVFRKSLVIFQFVLSIALIIITVILSKQMHFLKNQSKGYNMDALIEIYAWFDPFIGKYESIREQLLQSKTVTNVSASSSPVNSIYSNQSSFEWKGKPDNFVDDFAWVNITYDYIPTLKMNIVEGRNFSRDFVSDSNAIIINKAAQKYMGLTAPVGQVVKNGEDTNYSNFTIIGVVDDIAMGNPYSPVKQTFFSIKETLADDGVGYYQLKLNPENSLANNMVDIKKIWKDFDPDFPFDYNFVNDLYAEKFEEEDQMISLVAIFTSLAIFISCLGLFGLTSFVAEQRTKEIGIRKSIGASVFQIWKLVSKDFLVLVLIASVIAIPLAYILIQHWLSYFELRIPITEGYFILGIGAAFLLAIVTVSYHAIKAASTNPIKSLKTE
ncbi:ABC transporter permease [Aquimarina agarivorans]|uniref:ABC transporter permease n=1 Tax=Aquimarina agarivorans TaxID=980584 RepID=UPI000248FD32|nr:ABC transporter permease [Aquimarina agarivorans]